MGEWEMGDPVMMQREKWAMDMAKDASQLPGGYFVGGVYSAHPNDSTGTWRGDAAVISQIMPWRGSKSRVMGFV